MDSFKFQTICPDCGQKHDGVTRLAGDVALKDNGFGVCANCGSIFATKRVNTEMQTFALKPAQLIHLAQTDPKMFAKLLESSNYIKKYRFTNQKN